VVVVVGKYETVVIRWGHAGHDVEAHVYGKQCGLEKR